MNDSNEFDFENFKYIDKTVFNILERYEVKEHSLIISIAGSVGKVKMLKNIPNDKRIILTENCAKISIKDEGILLPEFLSIILSTNFLKRQIEASYIQTTIPKLGLDKILNLRIPELHSLETQQQIVDIYNNAYAQKQAKEAEAKELLASIDTYLLNELGITLPEKDNSLEARIFTTNFSEVVGGRFDPFGIINQNMKIEGGIYENYSLKKLAVLQKGQSITSDKIIEGDYPVIAGGQSSPYNHNVYNHKGNVITVSASGAYSGYVWYHHSPIFASDCTMIYSKDETNITTIFLFEILKCKQSEIYSLQQGAGQPHVYARDLEKLQIPLPPLEKQNEIAAHIAGIRTQAKALQQEAEQVLEAAKQQVEQMILG